MRSDTQSINLDGRTADIFAFLANPENLPRWAVGFCHAIRRDGETRWIVETGACEIPVRYVTNAECGTIDFHMEPTPGAEFVAYSRLLSNGEGAEYVFTQFQGPGVSDEVFDHQVMALKEELRVLQSICRARAACPA